MNSIRKLFFFILLAASLPAVAQNKVSKKIMEIGKTDNQTMLHLDVLTNRIGGRECTQNTGAKKWLDLSCLF
jgi:hypothetical protein